MALTANDVQEFLRLLEAQPRLRAQFRQVLITDDLHTLPGQFRQLTEIVGQLAEAQQRTEVRLEQLTARVDSLAMRMEELTRQVRELVGWQRGEAGRREGERYEALLVKRALALFNGGEGGSTGDPFVRWRLLEKLRPAIALGELLDQENPFLADLIWWKDEQFVVVEASIQVNGADVSCARWRVEMLRKANLTAIGMVIGDEWAGPDVRQQAGTHGVEWKVGDDFSQGWLDFRRL